MKITKQGGKPHQGAQNIDLFTHDKPLDVVYKGKLNRNGIVGYNQQFFGFVFLSSQKRKVPNKQPTCFF